MDGSILKRRRLAANIPGRLICGRAGIDRARLSDVERGYVTPTDAELDRIRTAIEELAAARQKVERFAQKVGWPM